MPHCMKINIMKGVTLLDFSRVDLQQILKANSARFSKIILNSLGFFFKEVLFLLIKADKLQIFNLKIIYIIY